MVQTVPEIKESFDFRASFWVAILKLDHSVRFLNGYNKIEAKNGPLLEWSVSV
jgi:hypothetical protein